MKLSRIVARSLTALFLIAALGAPAALLLAPSTAHAGIIMRDGGICDPIRHMGCNAFLPGAESNARR